MIILTKDNIQKSARVTRGIGWVYGDQDTFAGNMGTIINYSSNKSHVIVRWDGSGQEYDYNGLGHHELSISYTDAKFPEPAPHLVGKTILIHDPQGCDYIHKGDLLVVSGVSHRWELEFNINSETIRWTCNENYSGHFFEVVKDDVVRDEGSAPIPTREMPGVLDEKAEAVARLLGAGEYYKEKVKELKTWIDREGYSTDTPQEHQERVHQWMRQQEAMMWGKMSKYPGLGSTKDDKNT